MEYDSEKFKLEINYFFDYMGGIKKSFFISNIFPTILYKKEDKKLKEFIDKNANDLVKKDDLWTFKIDNPHDDIKYNNLKSELVKTDVAKSVMPDSVFISMVAHFDSFLKKIAKNIMLKKPHIIKSSLTFGQIKGIKEDGDILSFLLEKEMDCFPRQRDELMKWFAENLINITGMIDPDLISSYNEITERRNSIIHNDGIAGSQYVGCIKNSNIKKGDSLSINPDYFNKAHDNLMVLSSKILLISALRVFDEDDKVLNSINNFCVKSIEEDNLSVPKKIYDFYCNNFSLTDDLLNSLFIINRALVYKRLGDDFKDVLSKKSWNSCCDDLKLAVEILNENYDKALFYMDKIGKKSELIVEETYYQPLFYEFVKTDLFKKKYKEIYKKEFKVEQTDI